MERRKKGIVLILIAILIFGVFAGVEFFGKKEKKEPAQTSATAAIPSATPIPTSVVTITPKPPADAETEEDKKHCFGRNTSRDITAITSKCYGI